MSDTDLQDMVATRKRTYSGTSSDDASPTATTAASPKTVPSSRYVHEPCNVSDATVKRTITPRTDDIVQIWQHDMAVADLGGDIFQPTSRSKNGRFKATRTKTTLASSLTESHQPYAGTSYTLLPRALTDRHSALQRQLEKTQFRKRCTLGGHTSCVNSLALSRHDGRYLASGGDDREIHIRDLFVDLSKRSQTVPIAILKGHQSNIFSLAWSANNRYLFSAGNDSQILYYDVEHSNLPIRSGTPQPPEVRRPDSANSLGGHDDSIPEISAHSTNPFLLLSCDDGGSLKMIDIRLPHESVAAARSDAVAGFSAVQWNPNPSDGNTFAAATTGRITGSTRLYDVRQCFASDEERPLTSKDAVLSYHTALMQNSSKRGLIAAAAETNSICFDPSGRFLASSISRYHPTIYAVNDPDPLATLESTVVPDIVPESYNRFTGVPLGTPSAPKKLSSACTIKHGSFGLEEQTGKLHYAIGSDDFRAYVFEIPSIDELMLRREFVNRSDWIQETAALHPPKSTSTKQAASKASTRQNGDARVAEHRGADDNDNDEDDDDSDIDAESLIDRDSEVAYCGGSVLRANNIVRPARITQQDYVLCGGRSIINTALIHPTLPYILTAGIVSEIVIHSAVLFGLKDLYPDNDSWSSSRRDQGGGTRSRFLIEPLDGTMMQLLSGEDDDSESGSELDTEQDVESDELTDAESDAETDAESDAEQVIVSAGGFQGLRDRGIDQASETSAEVTEDGSDLESEPQSEEGFPSRYRRTASNENFLLESGSDSSYVPTDEEEERRERQAAMSMAEEAEVDAMTTQGPPGAQANEVDENESRPEVDLDNQAEKSLSEAVSSSDSSDGGRGNSGGYRYRRSSSNEDFLYGPPSTLTWEEQHRENEAFHDSVRDIIAREQAALANRRRGRRDNGDDDDIGDDTPAQVAAPRAADTPAEVLRAQASEEGEQQQGTVQDFLSAMRSDPLYVAPEPLDYQHDRHIATYSLSHLSPGVAPDTSASSSGSADDEGEDMDQQTSTSDSEPLDEDDDEEDLNDDDIDMDENNSFDSHGNYVDNFGFGEDEVFYYEDPFENDGYASSYILEDMEHDRPAWQDERRGGGRGEDPYETSSNGGFWATMRSMGSNQREQKRMRLFDELLRRDEMRSLTAGFRKVPVSAGGQGKAMDLNVTTARQALIPMHSRDAIKS